MVCEFPQWGFIHKHARGTLVIHRWILGSHGGSSHVIVGLSTFSVHTGERDEGSLSAFKRTCSGPAGPGRRASVRRPKGAA